MKTKKLKLLIVDDEERAWKILKINFQDRYEVFVAKNGADAVKVLDKQQVDVVLDMKNARDVRDRTFKTHPEEL